MSTKVKSKNETANGTKPVLGEVTSFNVATYSLLDKDVKYCHWSEGLNMIIEKNGVFGCQGSIGVVGSFKNVL
jgi:hypothetical protein